MNIKIENFVITGTNKEPIVTEIGEIKVRDKMKETGEIRTGEKDRWFPANLFEALKSIRGQLITKDGINSVDELLTAIDSSTKSIRATVNNLIDANRNY